MAPLQRWQAVLYADRLTVVEWVGLRRHRWDVPLLDIAAARVAGGDLRIDLSGGSVLTLSLTDAAEWVTRIAAYRVCLGPPE